MRLAAKLVLVYLIGLLLIVFVFTYLTVQNDRRLLAEVHQRKAAELVAQMSPQLRAAYQRGDSNTLRQVLKQSTIQQARRVTMRLVEPNGNGISSVPPGVPIDSIVAGHSIATYSVPDPSGGERLYTYVPLPAPDENAASSTIEVSASDELSGNRIRRSLIQSVVAILGVTLLSGLVILFGGVLMVGKPLNQLIEKVRRVGEGDFTQPLDVSPRDELGKLGVAINQMCEQLQSQREQIDKETAARLATVGQLRHADRLSTLGRLAAGVAHEMGTPLNVVSGRAELIAGGHLDNTAVQKSATAIKRESDRIAKIIRSLMDFARRGSLQRAPVELGNLVEQTVLMMKPLAEKKGIQIRWEAETDCISEVDSGQIRQVLTNLIVNAIAATPADQDEVVQIRVIRSAKTSAYGLHQIEITDHGHGIDPDHLETIFEPFFTTKDVGEGTGLGLSIVHGIVEDHLGEINVTSELGEGTTFTVALPVHHEDAGSSATSDDDPSASGLSTELEPVAVPASSLGN